jgi:hypothetical protein
VTPAISHELNILSRDVAEYRGRSGKTPEQTFLKQGGKLAANISSRLQKFMPGKGIVTTERLEALDRGEGVYVRPTIRAAVAGRVGARTNLSNRKTVFGKQGVSVDSRGRNLQALMVQRELAVRESGGGFMSYSARAGATKFGSLPGLKPGTRRIHTDRYKRFLASLGFVANFGDASMTFSWGGVNTRSSRVAKLLQTPRFQTEIVGAIRDTSADIRAYVPSVDRANAKASFR